MVAIFELIGFIVVLLVLCFVVFFIYKTIGSKRIVSIIFLITGSILILHLLLAFLVVFDPALFPPFLTKYAAQYTAWIFKLIYG
jgi:hypothetical protein